MTGDLHHVVRPSFESLLEVGSCISDELEPDLPEELPWFLLIGDLDDRIDLDVVVADDQCGGGRCVNTGNHLMAFASLPWFLKRAWYMLART